MKPKKIRVADYIAQFIWNCGVKHVFMLSGGGIMHLTDGLAVHKKLKAICVHHEQVASMALEAYSRTSQNFGVGYFTTGPGATNAITGLAGAWVDSVPCLFISGQVKRKEAIYKLKIPGLRQCGVQEINIIPIVESITKYAVFIDKPEDIKYHLQKAFFLAKNGRPGPVWLDIPLDVQGAYIDPQKLSSFKPPEDEKTIPSIVLKKFILLLKNAKRPVILAGYGVRVSGAIDLLLRLIERYKIPLVTTYLGVDLIPSDHPQYVGRVGIKGTRAGNLAIQNSDLLIVIGSSLPVAEIGYEYDLFAREAKKVVVDIDLSSHKKGLIKIDLLIESDAGRFITKALSILNKHQPVFDKQWPKICLKWRKKYPVFLPEYKKLKNKINIYYFIEKLSDRLGAGDVVITDAGSALYAGSQGIKIKRGVRYLTSGGFGGMGYSLPASIGACLAIGKKRIMCINGDGSFQQNLQELQTIVHHQLPIKIFIFNNEGYLSIRFTQRKFFQRYIGTGPESGLSFPETRKIALAYGIKFFQVSENNKLSTILDKVFAYKGPVICEIMTPKDQLIIPSVGSVVNPDGSMTSRPFEDMFPFLDRKEFLSNMIIKPYEQKKK